MTDYQDRNFWRGRIQGDPQNGPGHPDIGFPQADVHYNRIIEELIKPEDRVLDAGCGVGRMSEKFKNYVGIDFIPEFVDSAQKKYPEKTFLVADFNKTLPFNDKEFDWVISISSYQYCKSEELTRVGKKVLVLSYGTPEEYQIL